MRTKVKLKGGISLIVLVITIIVMIILAAAIILSLSNSGIIGKANKAKTDTDISNAKDLVAMAHADWMLDEAKIKENDDTITSFSNYAEKKLQEAGYKVGAGEGAYTVTEDGEVYTGLTETARTAVKAGIKVGDEVKYDAVLTEKSYTTDGSERSSTGAADSTKTQTVSIEVDTWRYIGLGEDGSLLIAPDMRKKTGTYGKLTLGDKGGYLNGPTMLNTVCDALYTVAGKGKAQSMNIDIVNKILEYNGPKGIYFDDNFDTIETAEAMTIGEIETKLNSKLARDYVLEGKDLGEYKSDYYEINKTEHANRITKDTVKQNLVYQAETYWLASSCNLASFCDGCAYFSVRNVFSSIVNTSAVFYSDGNPQSYTYAVRPYVSLTTNVQKTMENGKTVWTLS